DQQIGLLLRKAFAALALKRNRDRLEDEWNVGTPTLLRDYLDHVPILLRRVFQVGAIANEQLDRVAAHSADLLGAQSLGDLGHPSLADGLHRLAFQRHDQAGVRVERASGDALR